MTISIVLFVVWYGNHTSEYHQQSIFLFITLANDVGCVVCQPYNFSLSLHLCSLLFSFSLSRHVRDIFKNIHSCVMISHYYCDHAFIVLKHLCFFLRVRRLVLLKYCSSSLWKSEGPDVGDRQNITIQDENNFPPSPLLWSISFTAALITKNPLLANRLKMLMISTRVFVFLKWIIQPSIYTVLHQLPSVELSDKIDCQDGE